MPNKTLLLNELYAFFQGTYGSRSLFSFYQKHKNNFKKII